MIIRAILVVITELIIYWIIGMAAGSILFHGKRMNPGIQVIGGFLCYQILFQICALPFIMTYKSFTQLTEVWNIVLLVVVAVSILLSGKTLFQQVKAISAGIRLQPAYYVMGLAVIVFFCYYAVLNGRLDDDSIYYIGLVNTTLESDIMFRMNVYTGQLLPSLYLRRALVTFEIHSAVLAKNFQVAPIILMRISRSVLNIIMTAFALKGIGTLIYSKSERMECNRKSILFMIIALSANLLMDKTIYTSATFLLHRAYEGKSYAAGTLVLFVTYICLEMIIKKQKRNGIWLFLALWASVAISTSAFIVNAAAIVLWCGSSLLVKLVEKRRERVEERNAGC